MPSHPLQRIPVSARWSIVALIVVVALIVAIWPSLDSGDDQAAPAANPTVTGSTSLRPPSDSDVQKARAAANLQPCPSGTATPPKSDFAGLRIPCLGGGPDVDLGPALSGVPTLINIWATWCQPCQKELPLLSEFAQRAGDRVRVLTMQSPVGPANTDVALAFLAEVGSRLPAIDDRSDAVSLKIKLPQIYPTSVLVRADGSVAKVLPRQFLRVEEIVDVVRDELGVAV